MRALGIASIAIVLAITVAAKKKKGEEETQTLPLPKELPAAVTGETRRLSFVVTPLSARGLLSQQIRDALKNLERQAGGNPVIHIRAFVAGTGDLRRVRDLVSNTLTERHQPLPALSLIQAGALPLNGAQVVLEAVVNGRRDLYPGGLAFFPAEAAFADDPQSPLGPLLDRALAGLQAAIQIAGQTPSDVLRVSCFFSSLDNFQPLRERVVAEFPRAVEDYVQTERAPARAFAACEASAGIRETATPPRAPLRLETVPGGTFRFALVGAPSLVLTGTQVSFGYEDRDARLALDRLGKTLEPMGVSLRDVALAHFYPLSSGIGEQVRRQLPAFFDMTSPPAETFLEFEGLSAPDAAFAVDAVAAGQ